MDSSTLANEALKLSALERVHIIDALWKSLDPVDQTDIDRAWIDESHSRLHAFRSAQIEALDGNVVLDAIETDLRK